MTYDEILKILIQITDSLDKNKAYINNLDEKLGDGTYGSKLVQTLKKTLDQIHKLDTKEIALVFTFFSKIFSNFGGKIGKVYGKTLKDVGKTISGKDNLTLTDIILMVDFMINKLRLKVGISGINEHISFWNEVKKNLVLKKDQNKPVRVVVKETLNELAWAYPVTRSNAQSLVRVLAIRTMIKNL